MTHISETFGNYDLVKKFKLDFTDVVVSKWKSRSTGLTVIHLDYDGILFSKCVLVSDWFCLALQHRLSMVILWLLQRVRIYFSICYSSYMTFKSLRWLRMPAYTRTVSTYPSLILLYGLDTFFQSSIHGIWKVPLQRHIGPFCKPWFFSRNKCMDE